MTTQQVTIEPIAKVPTILALIHEPATYEKATSSVLATAATLRSTFSIPSSPQTGYPAPPPPFPQNSGAQGWRSASGTYLDLWHYIVAEVGTKVAEAWVREVRVERVEVE